MPLAEQDRSQWDTERIAEGVAILQAALARDQLGEYQAQAAIAALHADAPRFEDTDWAQIVEWYDELLRFADTPIVRLNRAVAVGEANGAPAGLAALADIAEDVPRRDAVAAHLLLSEPTGDEWALARLRQAAASAIGRGAPDASVEYLRRALAEPPAAGERSAVKRELGLALLRRDDEEGIEILREVHSLARTRVERAEIAAVLSNSLNFRARYAEPP